MSCEARRSRRNGGHHFCHRERSGLQRRQHTHIRYLLIADNDDQLTQRLLSPDLNLCILPPRDLNYKVDDPLITLIGVKRNIVPERNRISRLFEPDPPVLKLYEHYSLPEGSASLTKVFRAPTVRRLKSA